MSGATEYQLAEIVRVIEASANKGHTKLKYPFLGLGISDFVEEFFVGIAHDKNLVRMAKFFE